MKAYFKVQLEQMNLCLVMIVNIGDYMLGIGCSGILLTTNLAPSLVIYIIVTCY